MRISYVGTLAAGLSLLGTGCATKKYVARVIAPVDARVTAAETKNGDQDKQIATQTKEIEDLDRDLSRTKERLTDVDGRATAAGLEAKKAGDKADGAWKAADGAKSLAQQGLLETSQLARRVDAMNHFQILKSETVLFGVNKAALSQDAKAQIEELAKSAEGLDRYVIEVQGFTDITGSAVLNERLSEARAHEVARFLANEYKIPLRSIYLLGSGYAQPVANDKTKEGRKLNRRVEVRLFVPDAAGAGKSVSAKAAAEDK